MHKDMKLRFQVITSNGVNIFFSLVSDAELKQQRPKFINDERLFTRPMQTQG